VISSPLRDTVTRSPSTSTSASAGTSSRITVPPFVLTLNAPPAHATSRATTTAPHATAGHRRGRVRVGRSTGVGASAGTRLSSPSDSHAGGEYGSVVEGVGVAGPGGEPSAAAAAGTGFGAAPGLTNGARAAATSAGVWKRSAGSLAIIRATTSASTAGTSGRT